MNIKSLVTALLLVGNTIQTARSRFLKRPYLVLVFTACSLCAAAQERQPGYMAGLPSGTYASSEGGMIFRLSGGMDFTPEFAAGGQLTPNFLSNVKIINDGAVGRGFSADDDQLLSYWAPGNIYAQRGTISFFWRPRYEAGNTPFPIFRVSYADHSSWDMTWLRIDYNGAGFDAFVTDIGLSRTRVSYYPDKITAPDEWIHLALSWDETEGIRFYMNGELVARQTVSNTVYDTGLDQFGTHSRIISPYQVQSAYCFMRGGDFDELQIYDRMLTDDAISEISAGMAPKNVTTLVRKLDDPKWRNQWWLRNGWNLPNPPPPVLPGRETTIKKVEIHDAYDIKRWYWKANDGIRETTWPGVYNMSRLPGRYDYFVLPDWDCYSGSGQSVRFTLPDEEWNHIEIWGKAWGQLTFENDRDGDYTFAARKNNQIKSVHAIREAKRGGKIRFDNALIEEPIGSFDVYNVLHGEAPLNSRYESFVLGILPAIVSDSSVISLISFINGRYPADERSVMMASEPGKSPDGKPSTDYSYPCIHVLIPYSNAGEGLDGIEIRLPALNVKPTHNDLFPMNIRIKDPLWPMRDLADFSFSVKSGDSPVLWFDTRDRILPQNHVLYLTISGAGDDLSPDLLKGTAIRLVYKNRADAKTEHVADRFTQIRDLYGHIVEEHPASPRLNLYNRFVADCSDLLSADPDHWLAKTYLYAATGKNKPEYSIPECPPGVPEWAFLQAEYLRHLQKLVFHYIDNRQIANGEFGGGLSDDGDLTNMWPGLAFLGIDHDKIRNSLKLHMSAYFDNERPAWYASLRQRSLPLFTNNLATIITDELHALEEGIQVISQMQLLDYGNPYTMEKCMLTTLSLADSVTGINKAGHRHFRSRLYGGTSTVTSDPWQWSVNRSYLVLHPAYLVAQYNGNRKAINLITGLADGLLAHQRNGNLNTDINFETDEDREDSGMAKGSKPWALFKAGFMLTGDKKYFEVLPPENPSKGVFSENSLVQRYRDEINRLGIFEYINTEGSTWIDRVTPFNPQIQEDRLGGVALTRTSALYPAHYVSWKFEDPQMFDDVAIFLPSPSADRLKIIGFNLNNETVRAGMRVWNITPGKWKIIYGTGQNGNTEITAGKNIKLLELERGMEIPVSFVPGKYTIINLELAEPSGFSYSDLPDPAIGEEDIRVEGNTLHVKVHNIGAIKSPPIEIRVTDRSGNSVVKALVETIEAPVDLHPRWKEISIELPRSTDPYSCTIELDPDRKIREITRMNNITVPKHQNASVW